MSDGANRGNKLMNGKKYLQIDTLDVRTLRKKCKLNIFGIVDHKIAHEGPLFSYRASRKLNISNKCMEKQQWSCSRRCRIDIVSGLAEKALAEVIPINDRIITVTFNGYPSIAVIINYQQRRSTNGRAPTEGSKAAEEHL